MTKVKIYETSVKTKDKERNKNSTASTGWSVKNKRINLTEIQQKVKENPLTKTIMMERNDYNKLNITLEDEYNIHLLFDETMYDTMEEHRDKIMDMAKAEKNDE